MKYLTPDEKKVLKKAIRAELDARRRTR